MRFGATGVGCAAASALACCALTIDRAALIVVGAALAAGETFLETGASPADGDLSVRPARGVCDALVTDSEDRAKVTAGCGAAGPDAVTFLASTGLAAGTATLVGGFIGGFIGSLVSTADLARGSTAVLRMTLMGLVFLAGLSGLDGLDMLGS